MPQKTILQLDSSMRINGSISRRAGELVTITLLNAHPKLKVNYRDLAKGLPLIDEKWINANFTPEDDRDDEANTILKFSNQLVTEVIKAKYIVIASPTYNFNIPAYLKAWVDLITRVKLTFRYTENGPIGLLENKRAYLVIASGGVPIGSDGDFVSQYLQRIMRFIGITDVKIIDASQVNLDKSYINKLEEIMA